MSEHDEASDDDAALRAIEADSTRSDWLVLRTRSRQEKVVVDLLGAQGVVGFLPLTDKRTVVRHRPVVTRVPLFAGYVFMAGDVDAAYELDRAKRIAQVIRPPVPLALAAEVAALRRAALARVELTPAERLREGMAVRVIAGPLRGTVGEVSSIRARTIVLNVDLIGAAAVAEVDPAYLEPIEP